jgi:hypothetical protein
VFRLHRGNDSAGSERRSKFSCAGEGPPNSLW